MPLLIGADEAGYGPNFGPLVVAISVWRVPASAVRPDLYELLHSAVSRAPEASERGAGPRLAIGDSKKLYDPATGIAALERGVLAAWGASTAGAARPLDEASTWRDLWEKLDATSRTETETALWHKNHARRIPTTGDRAEILASQERLRAACAAAGVELVGLRARGVFPEEFNRGVLQWGNKAELLSHTTIGLIREAIEVDAESVAPQQQVWVSCDKHGGRNHYAAILQHSFPGPLVEVRRETRAVSTYRWREAERRVEIEFRTGGETALPVALASMTAKYLRELAMGAFNAFWREQVPGIRATAGYPTDARRFKQDIAVRQQALGIADEVLWRSR